ncbi:hypothetical protein [Vibrio kanaloae]|uniref:hypothetical protein n=1 Tax=Vibrio kanaloae TaxID=170673 RepID=UPI00158DB5B2|nr:hypothetical protein [Vibrio kanaloae]QPK06488.1 hypothetical protein BTD91_15095 [Vibrio kanaloae]
MKIFSIFKLALQDLVKRKDEYAEQPEEYEVRKKTYLAAAKRCDKDTYEEYKDKV